MLSIGASTGGVAPSEAEVTDLQFAIRIYQEVARLQIPMKDVCGVDVLETAKSLIEERLEVGI